MRINGTISWLGRFPLFSPDVRIKPPAYYQYIFQYIFR